MGGRIAMDKIAGTKQEIEKLWKQLEQYEEELARRNEKKDRRVQLLLQPSLYYEIKEKAMKQNKSVNQFVHDVLEKTVWG